MLDVVGIFITLCAAIRLCGTGDIQGRHFFFVLTSFLFTSTLIASVRNRLVLGSESIFLEWLLLPSFVVLGLQCLGPLPLWTTHYRTRPSIVYVTESLSPLFLGIGLLGASINIWSRYPALGCAGVSVAVIAYGIRNVITQSEQMATDRSLLVLQDELQNLVVTDVLTGMTNRRGFDQLLGQEWNRAIRMQYPLALLMIDVDYFKILNDMYGHRRGDQCLVRLASALRSALTRAGDVVARYGGEEFVALLPATDRSGAEQVARKMQEAVRLLEMENETPIGKLVTVSIGIANYEFPHNGSPAELIDASDRALYAAKRNGRNRIEHSSIQSLLADTSVDSPASSSDQSAAPDAG
jgi:diguanylate cyclase (GGDEF)-like protein